MKGGNIMTVGEMEDLLENTTSEDKAEEVHVEDAKKQEIEVLDERYRPMTLSNWFVTFMCMNIPIIGLVYLIGLCFSKEQVLKRDFARAYLLYKFVFLVIAVVLVGVFCYYGLELADNALKFMQEL